MGEILVIGATGNVGARLIPLLARAGEQVRAATRDPDRVPAARNVQAVRFDYAHSGTFEAALAGVDRVFLVVADTTSRLSPSSRRRRS